MKSKLFNALNKHKNKVNKLFSDLEQVKPENITKIPANGGWSAMQTIQHLIKSEELSLAYTQKKLSFGGEFEDKNLASECRYLALYWSLVSPVKFKAPPAISTEHLPNDVSLQQAKEQWAKVIADWEAFFKSIPEELSNKLVYKHPRAGKITFMNMLDFFGVHFDRHLKQINKAVG